MFVYVYRGLWITVLIPNLDISVIWTWSKGENDRKGLVYKMNPWFSHYYCKFPRVNVILFILLLFIFWVSNSLLFSFLFFSLFWQKKYLCYWSILKCHVYTGCTRYLRTDIEGSLIENDSEYSYEIRTTAYIYIYI